MRDAPRGRVLIGLFLVRMSDLNEFCSNKEKR